MRLQEIMSKSVETIPYDHPAELAWERMKQQRIHHLVVMRGHEVVGVLSSEDLGGAQGEYHRRDQIVSDMMSPRPVTASPQTTVREAANLLRGRSIGCLPIMEKEKLVGIVTVTDLLELIGRGTSREAPKGEGPTMKRRGPRRKAIRRAAGGA